MTTLRAIAHSNIALIKYWGKQNIEHNVPSTGSLSITLDAFYTTTDLTPIDSDTDEIEFEGSTSTSAIRRIRSYLDKLRFLSGKDSYFHIRTKNNFPTASGLASSASGFAALAIGFVHATGIEADTRTVSEWAGIGSGSAARSIFGGFAAVRIANRNGKLYAYAEQLAAADFWPEIRMVVAQNAHTKKKVSSTEGMMRTKRTSPYWQAWVEANGKYLLEAEDALSKKDVERLGELTEASCFAMHASMMASHPALLYWNGATVDAIHAVWELRAKGTPAYVTIDAGAHVKVLTTTEHAGKVSAMLKEVSGIEHVHETSPGPDAYVEEIEP